MKAITKASRVNTALQVIRLMNDGKTVVEACQVVGLPHSSFYCIMENNPEAISEIQAIIDTNNREQLGLTLMAKNEMLRKIVEDGLSDTTMPRDRLAIYMNLNEIGDDITVTLQDESQLNKNMQELMMRGVIQKR